VNDVKRERAETPGMRAAEREHAGIREGVPACSRSGADTYHTRSYSILLSLALFQDRRYPADLATVYAISPQRATGKWGGRASVDWA